MNPRHQLEAYLGQARRRLQWILTAQGAVLLAVVLLVGTLTAAWLLRRAGFSDSAATTARIALALAAAGAAVWIGLRWHALRRGEGANALERALPTQSGRVATFLQESAKSPEKVSPLLDLLAEDARRVAEREPLETTIPAHRMWLPAAGAAAVVALFVGLLQLAGPFGEGARHLWLGKLPPATSIAAAAGGIAVRPGDATVRRNQDLPIAALVAGASGDVTVHVRFESAGEWETAPMQADAEGGYAFTLYAVRDAARYYVTAGNLKSAEHRIDVVDLPTVESLRLTYQYPRWTGLPQRLVEAGGDIRAVAGTRVGIEVVTDVPLEGPLLIVNGDDTGLSQSGQTSRGDLSVSQPGHYRIATRFGNEIVPLTRDYVIELVEDERPSVQIVRPGRDYRATAIEEVPVRVRARDDFRLESLELHYAVNGGEWQVEKLSVDGAEVQAATLLRLEEMRKAEAGGPQPLLEPGDLVTYFAQARDHQHTVQTELFMVQVQPFEQRFTQAQAGGGGGGGGGGGEEDEGDISRRQREVLLATWNLQRNRESAGDREAERLADNARMLAEVQQTLAGQATTLVERARARQLTGQDASVTQFVRSLEEAAKAMAPAAKSLTDMDLQAAIQHEQQALQHLLRAEATFRDIQVAMQNPRGGGGGGGQAGRDVSEMTELELDLERNQYETEPQMTAQQRNQAEDETLRRLRELARRQEQLAREAARQSTPQEAQRWQQEQLRRELEQLRQQLEQLAQQQSQQGQQQSGSQQQGQQGRQGQQQQGSQQGGSQQRSAQSGSQQQPGSSAAEAAQQVAQALEQMQGGDREAANRASEQLNRARQQLEQAREDAERQRFSSLADTARDLADRQRAAENELRAAIGNRPPASIASPGAQRGGQLTLDQQERMAAARRQMQAELEELQRRMDSTRRETAEDAPGASRELANARRELQEMDIVGGIGRSAMDIQRGRGVQAATREPVITDTLERLRQNLEQAASTAAGETGPRQQGRQADVGDLLAELGDVQRALEQARRQGLAQNQRGSGDPGAQSPDAREGQAGQSGGQQGQQGQGGQGQGGQGGDTPGEQGGQGARAGGGMGNFGLAGGGGAQGPNAGQFIGGGARPPSEGVPTSGSGNQALREQGRISAERLAQLREQLRASGALNDADATALQELSQQLRRGIADPMAAEYQRITALVNQVELAALRVQESQDSGRTTRGGENIDDSRRYRDNVAEYYRRLGGGND